ncbi:solute carrier family 44 protein member 2 [Planoprotostelium fungivorum]|uniref:Solute carrier family 44 protein member 2 n=1 Tax=Planoprotostelium fungivorum TaxID=1890364 RepID=A0A2P6MRY6_9EUKA|nr:solute carrier family 44 protein member 2 [Planoprotostelium fungivorum]
MLFSDVSSTLQEPIDHGDTGSTAVKRYLSHARMGCFGSARVAAEDEPCGPLKHRGCTDIFWLILFLAFLAGMGGVAYIAVSKGNMSRLDHGIDSYGNTCGMDNFNSSFIPQQWQNHSRDMTNLPYLYWPNPFKLSEQLCLSSCPQETEWRNISMFICEYDVTPTLEATLLGHCWPPYQSKPVLGRCVPDVQKLLPLLGLNYTFEGMSNSTDANGTAASDLNIRSVATQIFSDVYISRKWIAIGLASAVGFGLLWIVLMRFLAAAIIWFTIVVVYVLFIALSVFLFLLARRKRQEYDDIPTDMKFSSDLRNIQVLQTHYEEGVSYAVIAVTVIGIILLIWMAKRIRMAVMIVEEASKAIGHAPSVLLLPIWTMFWFTAFTAYWVVIACYLASCLQPNYNSEGKISGYQSSRILEGLQWYHLFGLFWIQQFILAMQQTTIAAVVAVYYWTKDKKDVPWFPIVSGSWLVLRYHLGSLAFGSFIIAVIKFIRAIIKFIQTRISAAKAQPVSCLLKSLDCFFGCLEGVIKYLCERAYIMIAIKGESFCSSARRAFGLILDNILRIGVVGVISAVVLFLCKIAITASATLLTLYLVWKDGQAHYIAMPVIVVGLLSFIIASSFMNTFHIAIDTILLCFCEDCSSNDGSQQKPYYMPDSLLKLFDKQNHPPPQRLMRQKKEGGTPAEKHPTQPQTSDTNEADPAPYQVEAKVKSREHVKSAKPKREFWEDETPRQSKSEEQETNPPDETVERASRKRRKLVLPSARVILKSLPVICFPLPAPTDSEQKGSHTKKVKVKDEAPRKPSDRLWQDINSDQIF